MTWTIDYQRDCIRILDTTQHLVAVLATDPEDVRRARLIAAAPVLREAIEEALNDVDYALLSIDVGNEQSRQFKDEIKTLTALRGKLDAALKEAT